MVSSKVSKEGEEIESNDFSFVFLEFVGGMGGKGRFEIGGGGLNPGGGGILTLLTA